MLRFFPCSTLLFLIIFIAGTSGIGFGKEGQGRRPSGLTSILGAPPYTMLNIGNWAGWIESNGSGSRDPLTANAGVWYPRGTANIIYADGIIWGGWVQDSNPDLRVGGQTYRTGTQPGWIATPGDGVNPPVPIDPNDPRARIYRVRRDWQQLTVSDPEVIRDAAELNGVDTSQVTPQMAQAVLDQYALDWNEWPVDLGAPYYDVDRNGSYTPGLWIDFNNNGVQEVGEVEEPGLALADQVIWTVCNDVDIVLTSGLYGSLPIGLELQITMWGYKTGTGLTELAFRRYRIFNYSGFAVDSMFFSMWSDPDIGDYTNDLAGCDSVLNIAYGYNGDPVDADYLQHGLAPAAGGYGLVQGPMVFTGNPQDTALFAGEKYPRHRNLGMTSFAYFAAGSTISDPPLGYYEGTIAWYNMQNGYLPITDSLIQQPYLHGCGPLQGRPTRFPLNGDPVAGTGDLDNCGTNLQPGDRRIVLSCGPINFANGEMQEMVVALAGGIGGDYLSSVAELKSNIQDAYAFYRDLHRTAPIVGIEPDQNALVSFELRQNYPNPFNPATNIEFRIVNSEFVTLEIYDLLGREVKTLVNEHRVAGNYSVQWDGTDDAGQPAASGVYLYRLKAGDFSQTRKMVLMR